MSRCCPAVPAGDNQRGDGPVVRCGLWSADAIMVAFNDKMAVAYQVGASAVEVLALRFVIVA